MEQSISYVFGGFSLDTATELLWNKDVTITIAPKTYRLLLYFLQNPERLISHEELFSSVWEGRCVDDSAIRLAVNALRKALQDNPKLPEYILTVHKKGYRFTAKLSIHVALATIKAELSNPLHYRDQTQGLPVHPEHGQHLAELVQALLQSSNGERRLIFLQGEQQVGKTSLLNSFLASVHHSELSVLRARCVQMHGNPEPFMPLLEALERQCREVHGKLLIEQLGELAPSWLTQMSNVLSADELAMLQLKGSQIATLRMLREGAELIERLSKDMTFILILDNAHWSDNDTLDLLNFLMFRCSATKLLIILSYRSCDKGAGVQRIAKMQAELVVRGFGKEIVMQKGLS